MADPRDNIVTVEILIQRLGMTRILAEHTVEAIRNDDGARTEEWLRRVSREDLLCSGVQPFAADMIASYQTPPQNNGTSQDSNNGNGFVNGGILLGGAALGATQATAVGTAGLATLGFGSTGVAAGSVAAAVQGSATAAGSWFALCQSAGATGAIAGPVGVVAGVAAAGIGLGIASLIVHVKNGRKKDNQTSGSSNNPEKNKKQPATAHSQGELTVAFLMDGIADLAIDDATRLLNRFNAIHVLTISDFLIVSPATMRDTFDDVLGRYIRRIEDYQTRLRPNLTSSEGRSNENEVSQ